MFRLFLGSVIVAGFFSMLSHPRNVAAQKGGNSGTVAKVNAKTGAITINMFVVVKKKRELSDKEFFLNDDAKVTINEGGSSKIMTGKEAIEKEAIKEGMVVSFVPDGDLKIKELTIGAGKKKP